MIKINGEIVTINKFPDGTPRVNIDINNIEEDSYDGSPCIWIEWIYAVSYTHLTLPTT